MLHNEQMPTLAQKAMEDLISDDKAINIKHTLTDFLYEWIQSDVDYGQQERSEKLSHYKALLKLLNHAEHLEAIQEERRVSV